MNILTQNFGKVSNIFGGPPEQDELSAGVQASFGIIGYKGKVWRTRYRGVETPLMRADGDGPRSSIDVVILKASSVISKTWYEGAFVEGVNAPPDCFSTNGVSPSIASPKRQSNVCATCKRNVWGSKITPAGKNSKECNDTKRLAVVPELDIRNEGLGGPMLLRVPPASLATMAAFGSEWNQKGFPYYSIVTRIEFDANEAYPKFNFKAVRPLSDEEAQIVLEMRELPQMERILQEGSEFAGDPRLLQEGVPQAPHTGQGGEEGGTGWVKPQVSEAQVAQAQSELQGGFGRLGVAGQAPASSPPTSSAPAQTQTNSTSSTPKARGSRSTGAASSRSAPPAASTGLTAPATTNSSAPATASPATPAPSGFGTASSASNGSDEVKSPPQTTPGRKLNPADVPDDDGPDAGPDAGMGESETNEGTGVDPFEEELDAQLNAFLPQ